MGEGNALSDNVAWTKHPSVGAASRSPNRGNLGVYVDLCVHGAYMGCQCTHTVPVGHKKCFLPPRVFLSRLLSYHPQWAGKMPTSFTSISPTFVGRKSCCKKNLRDALQNQKERPFGSSVADPRALLPPCGELGAGCTFCFPPPWPTAGPAGPLRRKPGPGEGWEPSRSVAAFPEPVLSSVNAVPTPGKPSGWNYSCWASPCRARRGFHGLITEQR